MSTALSLYPNRWKKSLLTHRKTFAWQIQVKWFFLTSSKKDNEGPDSETRSDKTIFRLVLANFGFGRYNDRNRLRTKGKTCSWWIIFRRGNFREFSSCLVLMSSTLLKFRLWMSCGWWYAVSTMFLCINANAKLCEFWLKKYYFMCSSNIIIKRKKIYFRNKICI